MAQHSIPDPPPAPIRPQPSPLAALVLFACALIAILAWSLVAARAAVPPSAFVLLAMALVLLTTAVRARTRRLTGWVIGAGIAALGLLAGGYSLVLLPREFAAGDPPIATLGRAATAVASLGFLLWAALAWWRYLRAKHAHSPLTPIGWR